MGHLGQGHDGIGCTGLGAKVTAGAGGAVDLGKCQHFLATIGFDDLLPAGDQDSRAADVQAVAAAGAETHFVRDILYRHATCKAFLELPTIDVLADANNHVCIVNENDS